MFIFTSLLRTLYGRVSYYASAQMEAMDWDLMITGWLLVCMCLCPILREAPSQEFNISGIKVCGLISYKNLLRLKEDLE